MALLTLATEDSMADHRRFFLGLNPTQGQLFAHHTGGYPIPSVDVQEAEVREVLGTTLRLAMSGANDVITNHSWWMLQLMDPGRRMNRQQANNRADELNTYASSLINALIHKGILQWGDGVPEPPQEMMDNFFVSKVILTDEEIAAIKDVETRMMQEDADGDEHR